MILLIIPPEIQSIQQFRFFFTAELTKIFNIEILEAIFIANGCHTYIFTIAS